MTNYTDIRFIQRACTQDCEGIRPYGRTDWWKIYSRFGGVERATATRRILINYQNVYISVYHCILVYISIYQDMLIKDMLISIVQAECSSTPQEWALSVTNCDFPVLHDKSKTIEPKVIECTTHNDREALWSDVDLDWTQVGQRSKSHESKVSDCHVYYSVSAVC